MSEKSPFKNCDFRPGRFRRKDKKTTPLSLPSAKEVKRNRRKGRKGYTFMGNQI